MRYAVKLRKLALFLAFFAGNLAWGQPRHVVFLIHGIGSDAAFFKTTEQVLRATLPLANPQFSYEFVRFHYKTGDDHENTFTFAKDFGSAIAKHFEETRPVAPGDKVSLVMHSQGGLVGLLWLWHAFLQNPEYHPEYTPYVDAFITLGTPFWGAQVATFSHRLKDWATRLHLPFPFPFGSIELREMSFGSETIFAIRRAATRPELQDSLRRIRAQVRPLSLGGIITKFRALAPLAPGVHEYEDDTAVPLPSARFDFLHTTVDGPYMDGDVLPYKSFQETELANLQVVDAVHLSLKPEWSDFPGIAQLPLRCAADLDCRHPSFRYIIRHLAGEVLQPDETLLRNLTSFLVDLSIRIPKGSTLTPKDVKIRFSKENYGWLPGNRKLKVGHPLQFFSRGRSDAENNPDYLRFYFTGTVINSYQPADKRPDDKAFAAQKLVFRVSAPGFKSRIVEAKIRATYTTFVQLNLDPK